MTKRATTRNRRSAKQAPRARRRRRVAADDAERSVVCRHCGKRFRAVNNFHLRARHGYDGEHPVYDYERHFGLPVAMCGNSRISISEGVTEFWKEAPDEELKRIRGNMSASGRQRWQALPEADRERLAKQMSAAMTRYWKKLGKHWTRARVLTHMRQRQRMGLSLRKSHVPSELHDAAKRRFGSWKEAVETLGLNKDEGRPANSAAVAKEGQYLYLQGRRFFGSWDAACVAAGIGVQRATLAKSTNSQM